VIRTLWVGLNLLIATIPFGSIIIIGSWFGAGSEFFRWASSTWAAWVLWASGTRVRMEGLENLALDRPQIIVSNHSSWYDVFALAAHLPKVYRFIAKVELSRIPLFGRAWLAAGHIAIDRADHQAALAALDRAGNLIRSDNSAIVIFPEGTRSATGELLPFKKGGFMVALRTGVDIVPCAVTGSRAVMAKDSWRVHKGEITIRFGKPISAANYSDNNRDELMQRVRNDVAAMLNQPALPDQVN
jgi:1-acyl-sn-glycerol-3-phosphate acyltransferase